MHTPCIIYLSPGNRKMAYPTWSLPARDTCPGKTAMCSRVCYAAKGERLYKQTRPCRFRNYAASLHPQFAFFMANEIAATGAGRIRIHESGDFYDQAYLDKWLHICRELPHVGFLAFTKSFHLDYTHRPKNLSVFWSVFPDTDPDSVPLTGPRAIAGKDKKPAPLQARECPGRCDNCNLCWDDPQDTYFKIH